MPRVWQAEPKAGCWHLWASEGTWGRRGSILRAAVCNMSLVALRRGPCASVPVLGTGAADFPYAYYSFKP